MLIYMQAAESQHVQRHHGGLPTAAELKQGKVVELCDCNCFSQIKERENQTGQGKMPPQVEKAKGTKGKATKYEKKNGEMCSQLMCVLAERSN